MIYKTNSWVAPYLANDSQPQKNQRDTEALEKRIEWKMWLEVQGIRFITVLRFVELDFYSLLCLFYYYRINCSQNYHIMESSILQDQTGCLIIHVGCLAGNYAIMAQQLSHCSCS